MKRSFFLVSASASAAALALRSKRIAFSYARSSVVRREREAIGRLGLRSGCATHRSSLRWSAMTPRDLLG